ncbi:MAG: thioredoxin-related protein [Rhodothermales bacterium]|jgi:thioredoxin-related protein
MTRPFSTLLLTLVLLTATAACAQEPVLPDWIPFEQAMVDGQESGKMVLVDVWSPRCGWCRKMQEEVYPREDLLAYVNEHFITGRLNIDVKDDTLSYLGYSLSSGELSAGFGATGTPTTIFLSPEGAYITRLPGFHDYDSYFPVLRFIATESFRDMSFQDFMLKEGLEPNASGDQ